MKATKTMLEQVLSTGSLSSFRGWLTCMRQNQTHLFLLILMMAAFAFIDFRT